MAFFFWAQESVRPTADPILLARIRAHAATTLGRLPNFTCLETIERSRRRPPSKKHELIDVARLEVALVNGKELFAWPGSGQFDDREMRDLIPGGATGNGSFALHARAVMQGARTSFEYKGVTMLQAREAHHYAYRVPQNSSGFTLRIGPNAAVVGYEGEFWVDRQTLDLLRLTVKAVDAPPSLQLADHLDAMNYQRVRLGEESYLLPQSSELRLTSLDGVESRNFTSFTACKQYATTSVISFDDPEERAEKEAARAVAVRPLLPAGLELELVIRTRLEMGKTAVGDMVAAEVTRDAKLQKKTVVPKGALLSGRLIHFENLGLMRLSATRSQEVWMIGFDFNEVSTKEWRAPLFGTVKDTIVMRDIRTPSVMGNSLGRLIGGYHPSGHTLVQLPAAQHLEQTLRLIWGTRGEPLKSGAQ